MRYFLFLLVLFVFGLSVTACGNRGDLYLPETASQPPQKAASPAGEDNKGADNKHRTQDTSE